MNLLPLALTLLLLGSPSTTSLPPPERFVPCVQANKVCIDEGMTGLASDTRAKLERQISESDHVVIVLLPPAPAPLDTEDLQKFATRLDDLTNHQYIIGLSVGDQVIGQSSFLPSGVAADQMKRAKNVSMNLVETHLTFVMNVHRWLVQHPETGPSPLPVPPSSEAEPQNDSSFPWVIPLGGFVILGAIGAIIARRNRVRRASYHEFRFDSAPDDIKELLVKVMELRERVNEPSLQARIEQACIDTNEYFGRNTDPKFIETDTEQFSGHLQSVVDVLRRYVDIQNNTRYYRTPDVWMQEGRTAIEGFADFVLSSIQRGTDTRLMEYTVQTDILSAQKAL